VKEDAHSDTVLLVDDREASRYGIAHTLKHSGFEVIEASTGKAALELARTNPSLIILDVKLPDILGYEVCRRLKRSPYTGHIPVLQLSAAFLNNESKVYALESGADAYLPQPVDPSVLVATVRSLVRMHSAETLARLTAQQWQATFDSLSEGIALVSTRGRIMRCNRAMSDMTRLTYSDIERKTLTEFLIDHFGTELNPSSHAVNLETQFQGRHFRVKFDPVDVENAHYGAILIISEITAQKRAEAAILSTERLAATGRVAHTIAHEINNPLEAITNLMYLLQTSDDLTGPQKQYISLAQGELARVSRIARQILSFNRESALPVPIKLIEILDDVIALNNRAVGQKDLRIRIDGDRSIAVCGYPAQLRQVFSNVLRNAIEASNSGGEIRVRLSVASKHGASGEPMTRTTICDEGVGIPADTMQHIFEPFFTTKQLKGSGIGLWLSANIVREHGGTMQVRSNATLPKTGTCLSILLPRG
jgi:signal transduction histidine kinase